MMKLDNVTDLKAAKFVGTTDRTLLNWKKPKVLENGTKFYPAKGKHNLYRGARIITYLLDYDEVNINNLEVLKNNTDELYNLIKYTCKDNENKEQLENIAATIKSIVSDIDKLSSISYLQIIDEYHTYDLKFDKKMCEFSQKTKEFNNK
jgi:hypothetical protein